MLVAFLVMLSVVAMALLLLALSSWSVHREMVNDHCPKRAIGTYREFVLAMSHHKWKREPNYPTSFFDRSTNSEVHASIVQFDGCGMLLGFLDWIRVSNYLDKHAIRSARKNNLVADPPWNHYTQ